MTVTVKTKHLFVNEWLRSFDISSAASAIGVDVIAATSLLNDPEIRRMIDAGRGRSNETVLISAAATLDSLRKIAGADLTVVLEALGRNDGKPVHEKLAALPESIRYALKSITPTRFGLRVEMHGKVEALTLLGKALALWSDAVAVNVNTSAPEVRGALSDMTTQEKAEWFGEMVNGPTTH